MSSYGKKPLFCIVLFFIFLGMVSSTPVNGQNPQFASKNANGNYDIFIIVEQWEWNIYDNVEYNNLIQEGYSPEQARSESYLGNELNVQSDTEIHFEVASADIQHGFSINEFNIAFALDRVTDGGEFGDISTVDIILENEDYNLVMFCHIFCGNGHPECRAELNAFTEVPAVSNDDENINKSKAIFEITVFDNFLEFVGLLALTGTIYRKKQTDI